MKVYSRVALTDKRWVGKKVAQKAAHLGRCSAGHWAEPTGDRLVERKGGYWVER